MRIFVDFKNRGEAEVFKHEDPSARSLSYLENGGVFILICKGFTCGLHYCRCNNIAKKWPIKFTHYVQTASEQWRG